MGKNIFAVALLSTLFAVSLLYDVKLAVVFLLMTITIVFVSRSELAVINIYFFVYLAFAGFADRLSISLSGSQSINLLGILNIMMILFFYIRLKDFLQVKREYWNKSIIYPILLFSLYLVLTTPFSVSLSASVRGLTRVLAAFSFYLLTYFVVVNNKNIEKKIFKFITAIFIALLICGIVEYITGYNVFYGRSITNLIYLDSQVIQSFERIRTSFPHAPGYSFALLMFLPLYLYFFMRKRDGKYLYRLLPFLFLLNILLTFTRITWAAVAIQLILFFFLFKYKKILRFALPLGIIFVFISNQIISRASTVDSSALGRLEKFQYALSIFKDHPIFGSGIGTFFALSALEFDTNIAAHGDYMRMFAETGIFGGIGYVILLFTMIVFAVKNLKENDFAKAALLMLVGFMVFGITDNALGYSHIFWGLLGIYNGLIVRENSQKIYFCPQI
ncbi:O-antigen ligase family protein [uncultured Candidatus Kuenenia sp.]|uniref:O-antigen ligase family protein n=1 Tax=uncultured Candidatus Kuenenia sp. TaxID=1048336 RepID=UPI00031E27CF|nr:O-antigen ligase family protein [uncultured Candidatus Kuenenia sp.]